MSAWYAILDCARDHRLHKLVSQSIECRTLYDEPPDPAVASVSPYLVKLSEDEPLLPTWRKHGRGKSWGLMFESASDIKRLRTEFRKCLKARLPDGDIVMFRFYDPRVFLPYMLSSDAQGIAPWFKEVGTYLVEGEGGVQHALRFTKGQLVDRGKPVGLLADQQGKATA
ncbi:MAG: DUF4123 domain-containing protein [Pseudomonadota bacterium]